VSNLEVARASIDAFNRGDLDAALAQADPEVVIRDKERTGETFKGHASFRKFAAEWLETIDDYRIEVTEWLEPVEDVVVAVARQSGRGKVSGIEIADDINLLYRFSAGKIIEYAIYSRREDALEAAG
jgi:ketosteroid isomerase-like protein